MGGRGSLVEDEKARAQLEYHYVFHMGWMDAVDGSTVARGWLILVGYTEDRPCCFQSSRDFQVCHPNVGARGFSLECVKLKYRGCDSEDVAVVAKIEDGRVCRVYVKVSRYLWCSVM